MEPKAISIKEIRRRKLLLMLPIITLPFITILFYTLGGGQIKMATAENETRKGFNFTLPLPKFKEESSLDKMSYYDQAAVDSIKLQEQIKKDPYYFKNDSLNDSFENFEDTDFGAKSLGMGRSVLNSASIQDIKEKEVYKKLQALKKAIEPTAVNAYGQDMSEFENYGTSNGASEQIKNLEQIMTQVGEPQEPDPELQQLGGMLENILDIQHPSRVQERLKQSSDNKRGKVYSVNKKQEANNISLLLQNSDSQCFLQTNAFYSLDEVEAPEEMQNSIEAVIHQTQTIVNGSVVKLRLLHDILLQGTAIPKNKFLYGTASLKGERLEVKITNIQHNNSIFPVELAVYDIDGIDGIYIPGAISRDVAKASADRSIQTMGLTGISDSWGAQAAGMGIEAAKNFMSKKVKLIKVVVKAGYQVLLYDEKQKN
jgi:conjugative transposon TraM protein